MKSDQRPPQFTLLLRLLGGGYLAYLAYDLLKGTQGDKVFVAIAILFALIGGALIVHSLLTLVRSGYFYNTPEEQQPDEPDEEIE